MQLRGYLQPKLQIMLQVHADIRASRNTPERRPQLSVVYPDLNVLSIQEHIKTPSMIEM